MPNLNHVTLCGHLARDPELKFLPNGTAVCGFTIAANTGYGDNKKAHFIDVKCWKNTAEYIASRVKTGNAVLIEGEITQEKWETPEGKRSKIVINARSVQIVGQKSAVEIDKINEPEPLDEKEIPF